MKILVILLLSINTVFAFDQTHNKWDQILKAHTKMVKKQVLVDYKAIKKDPKLLKSYLKDLESLKKEDFYKFTKDEQLSFWINAYNAYTVKIVIDNYPIDSIKDIGSIFSSTWSKKFIKLFGKKMSLDGIEHETIRKQFEEPRIHFAVNCASIGCPSLYQEAFVASKLESQLRNATKHFMLNTAKNYKKGNTFYISKIFDWYGEDFDKYTMGVKNFVIKNIAPADNKKIKIKYLSYDWNLNEIK